MSTLWLKICPFQLNVEKDISSLPTLLTNTFIIVLTSVFLNIKFCYTCFSVLFLKIDWSSHEFANYKKSQDIYKTNGVVCSLKYFFFKINIKFFVWIGLSFGRSFHWGSLKSSDFYDTLRITGLKNRLLRSGQEVRIGFVRLGQVKSGHVRLS